MDIWLMFKALTHFIYDVEIQSAHSSLKRNAEIPYKYLRKLHYNVMLKTMDEKEADILTAG
jgi:hypothetical protein